MCVLVCCVGILCLWWGSILGLWGCEYSLIGSLCFSVSLSSSSGKNGNSFVSASNVIF